MAAKVGRAIVGCYVFSSLQIRCLRNSLAQQLCWQAQVDCFRMPLNTVVSCWTRLCGSIPGYSFWLLSLILVNTAMARSWQVLWAAVNLLRTGLAHRRQLLAAAIFSVSLTCTNVVMQPVQGDIPGTAVLIL